MKNDQSLQPITSESGRIIGHISAHDAPMAELLEGILKAAVNIERLQNERRNAIRQGIIPPCPWDANNHWAIGDRH